MIYRIIAILFILTSAVMPILLVKGSTSDADKKLENEEQRRYLEEWRKRKGRNKKWKENY